MVHLERTQMRTLVAVTEPGTAAAWGESKELLRILDTAKFDVE